MRILIADDHEDSAHMFKLVLEQFGEVVLASDGKQVINEVKAAWDQEQPFNLILMDVMMPNMDGIQALRYLREEEQRRNHSGPERLKVVMLTAYADEENMQRAFQLGCEGYLFKTQGKSKIMDRLRALGFLD